MGGKETIEHLRKFDPAIKAIISSGYSNDPIVENFSQYGFSGRLTKPYKITDLKNLLEQLMRKQ
jgi:CheY-like chemotaxis protein